MRWKGRFRACRFWKRWLWPGRREEALRLLAPLAENPAGAGLSLYAIALAYGYLGDEARALAWLERSAAQHESLVTNVGVEHAFDLVRARPAFQAFERRLHLSGK